MNDPIEIRVLDPQDAVVLRRMLAMFGRAFGDDATYTANQPDDAYLQRLLESNTFIAIAALTGTAVVGVWQATCCQSSNRQGQSSTSTTWQSMRLIADAVWLQA
jgi:hypothetical protein